LGAAHVKQSGLLTDQELQAANEVVHHLAGNVDEHAHVSNEFKKQKTKTNKPREF
jgi:hypothetical protein